MTRAGTRRRVGRVGVVGMLVVNTYVSLSGPVALWWEKESESKASTLPRSVRRVLSARPSISEADVHLTLWFVAGIFAVLAVRTWRTRARLDQPAVAGTPSMPRRPWWAACSSRNHW